MLASAALIERIGALPVGVTGRSLGPLPMRGKEQPIALYALEKPWTALNRYVAVISAMVF